MNMLKQRHGRTKQSKKLPYYLLSLFGINDFLCCMCLNVLRLLRTRKRQRKACNFNKFIATLHQ